MGNWNSSDHFSAMPGVQRNLQARGQGSHKWADALVKGYSHKMNLSSLAQEYCFALESIKMGPMVLWSIPFMWQAHVWTVILGNTSEFSQMKLFYPLNCNMQMDSKERNLLKIYLLWKEKKIDDQDHPFLEIFCNMDHPIQRCDPSYRWFRWVPISQTQWPRTLYISHDHMTSRCNAWRHEEFIWVSTEGYDISSHFGP